MNIKPLCTLKTDTQSHLPELPGAQQEGRNVAHLFCNHGDQVKLLEKAQGQQVMVNLFDEYYRVIHLAAAPGLQHLGGLPDLWRRAVPPGEQPPGRRLDGPAPYLHTNQVVAELDRMRACIGPSTAEDKKLYSARLEKIEAAIRPHDYAVAEVRESLASAGMARRVISFTPTPRSTPPSAQVKPAGCRVAARRGICCIVDSFLCTKTKG